MMEATTKDLRLHTRALISATDRGEQVVITFRGKPRAMLVPLAEAVPERPAGHNPAFGIWADMAAEHSVEETVRQLRKPRGSN